MYFLHKQIEFGWMNLLHCLGSIRGPIFIKMLAVSYFVCDCTPHDWIKIIFIKQNNTTIVNTGSSIFLAYEGCGSMVNSRWWRNKEYAIYILKIFHKWLRTSGKQNIKHNYLMQVQRMNLGKWFYWNFSYWFDIWIFTNFTNIKFTRWSSQIGVLEFWLD